MVNYRLLTNKRLVSGSTNHYKANVLIPEWQDNVFPMSGWRDNNSKQYEFEAIQPKFDGVGIIYNKNNVNCECYYSGLTEIDSSIGGSLSQIKSRHAFNYKTEGEHFRVSNDYFTTETPDNKYYTWKQRDNSCSNRVLELIAFGNAFGLGSTEFQIWSYNTISENMRHLASIVFYRDMTTGEQSVFLMPPQDFLNISDLQESCYCKLELGTNSSDGFIVALFPWTLDWTSSCYGTDIYMQKINYYSYDGSYQFSSTQCKKRYKEIEPIYNTYTEIRMNSERGSLTNVGINNINWRMCYSAQ